MSTRHQVVVVGGGFAGLSALRALSSAGGGVRRVLLDPGEASVFRPLLPDVVSGGLCPAALTTPFEDLARRWRFEHRRTAAVAVDAGAARVRCADGTEAPYDALIVATGARVTFYGRDELRQVAMTLDGVADAACLREAVRARPEGRYVVVGGGYTGVEVATHLRKAQLSAGSGGEVLIVEGSPNLCGTLPPPLQRYLGDEIARMGIRFVPNARVASATLDSVTLDNGERLAPARLVWSAGVAVDAPAPAVGAARTPQGRIRVDAMLQAAPRVFVAGDAAAVAAAGGILRMAVPFAIGQGAAAARNALRALRGQPLRRYRPCDPGYVVPMGQRRGCGLVFGVALYGRLPVWLHFCMSVYRAGNTASRRSIARMAVRG
ncbi:MAG: FAD-dependent oxidoreductase [Kiritimatiellae bacterium]|nr:FAD-dependent oxidoreductase [Kiritimatiellia bacterium]